MEKCKKKIKRGSEISWIVFVMILFAISLYIVEWSNIGSQSIGQYNNGYGTFDMKLYTVESVSNVLGEMQPEGFEVYIKYFIADYLFVLTFGTLQILLLNIVYKWIKGKEIRYLLWSVPVLRGACDIVENTLLLITLNLYPRLDERLIQISSKATWIKLLLIKIWAIMFIVGIIHRISRKRKKL